MSPSLRPSQSCPQDVCQIVKDQAGSNNNNQEPKIVVNDVTMMTSPVGPGARQPEDEEEDEVKEISRTGDARFCVPSLF